MLACDDHATRMQTMRWSAAEEPGLGAMGEEDSGPGSAPFRESGPYRFWRQSKRQSKKGRKGKKS